MPQLAPGGAPPVPFLASQVAAALGGDPLPAEMSLELGEAKATPSALTRDAMDRLPTEEGRRWSGLKSGSSRSSRRRPALLELPLVPATLPRDIDAAVRSWPTRAGNIVLERAWPSGQAPSRSSRIADLLAAKMVGVKAVPDITALVETSALLVPEESSPAVLGLPHQSELPLVLAFSAGPPRWGQPSAPAPS